MSEHEELTAEGAYARAVTGYDLFGETLRPYSQNRKDAAEAMGLQYPFLSEEDKARAGQTNRWPSLKRDMAAVLWLCSIKDQDELTPETRGDWTPERAFLNPPGAVAAAMEWINAKPWGDSHVADFTVAAATMCAIVLDVEISTFIVKVEGRGEPKKKKNTAPRSGRKPPPASRKSRDIV